jgi:hypothetical protein
VLSTLSSGGSGRKPRPGWDGNRKISLLISLTSSSKFLVSTQRCGSANRDNKLRKRLVTLLQSRLTWVGADERLMQLPFRDAWIECSEEHNHAHGNEGG